MTCRVVALALLSLLPFLPLVATSTGCILLLPAVPLEGEACLDGSTCLQGLQCRDGLCAKPVGEGEGEGEGECAAPGPECALGFTCATADVTQLSDEIQCEGARVGDCLFGCASASECPTLVRSPLLRSSAVAVADLVVDGEFAIIVDGSSATLVGGEQSLDPSCLGIELSVEDDLLPGQPPLVVVRARNIDIIGGGVLTARGAPGTFCGGLALLADGDLVVHAGGTIDLAASGSEPGCGGYAGGLPGEPGGAPALTGVFPSGPGTSGSHGTRGEGLDPGSVYGSSQLVPLLGGGGGGGEIADTGIASGGGGGGALYLSARRAVIVQGELDVRGSAGSAPAGAGAGGGILIEAQDVRFVAELEDVVGFEDGIARFSGGGLGSGFGAGRLRVRTAGQSNIANPNPPGDGPHAIADVGLGTDGDQCHTLFDVVRAAAGAEPPFVVGPPARLAFVEAFDPGGVGVDGPPFVASVTVPTPGAAEEVRAASSPDLAHDGAAVIAYGTTALLFSDGPASTSQVVVVSSPDVAYDAVAIDAQAPGRVALARGAVIDVLELFEPNVGAVVAAVDAAGRATGSAIAIAGADVAFLTADRAVDVTLVPVLGGPSRLLALGEPVVSLVGRGDLLLIGIDGAGANRGVVPARREGDFVLVAPAARLLNFRAPPEAIAVGFPRSDVQNITLAAAAAPLDDACFTNAGGIVLGQLNEDLSEGFDGVHAIIDPWDPLPEGQLGRTLAVTDRHIVASMGAAGVMVSRDDRRDIVVAAVGDVAHRVVALARGQIIIVDAAGNFLAAPLPP